MLLELIVALTLSGEIKQSELSTDVSASDVSVVTPAGFTGIYQSPSIDPNYSVEISAAVETEDTSHLYRSEIQDNVGCPYQNFADYLIRCRPQFRKNAWKRMVRENWLTFDKNRMKQFEAISRKYAFL